MASEDLIRRKLRVPDEVAALIRGCHPQLKRKIKAGLRQILTEPESGKPLKEELTGLPKSRLVVFFYPKTLKSHDYLMLEPIVSLFQDLLYHMP